MANCEARDLGDVRATLEKTSDVEYIYKKVWKAVRVYLSGAKEWHECQQCEK